MVVRKLSALIVSVLGLATVATLYPRQADACSCVRPVLQRTTPPFDGEVEFPTDGVFRVFLEGGFPEALRVALADEYRLRGDDGELVELKSDVVRTRLDLKPVQLLEPDTEYTLERV